MAEASKQCLNSRIYGSRFPETDKTDKRQINMIIDIIDILDIVEGFNTARNGNLN